MTSQLFSLCLPSTSSQKETLPKNRNFTWNERKIFRLAAHCFVTENVCLNRGIIISQDKCKDAPPQLLTWCKIFQHNSKISDIRYFFGSRRVIFNLETARVSKLDDSPGCEKTRLQNVQWFVKDVVSKVTCSVAVANATIFVGDNCCWNRFKYWALSWYTCAPPILKNHNCFL